MNSQGSILIVDDEQYIRQILMRTVVRAGFAADEAPDGVEALKKMETRTFDMVITDIQMPNMDGVQLLGRIRESYPGTVVILITGHKTLMPSDTGNHRADAVITKPFHNVEISTKLRLLYQNKPRPETAAGQTPPVAKATTARRKQK